MGEIKSLVKEADVQIYAIGIFDPIEVRMLTPEDAAGPALLKNLAKQSGGHLYEIENLNQLAGVASKIGDALRTQYVLGYYPTQSKHDGKYHKVEVKLAYFQSSRASLKDKPYYDEVLHDLLHKAPEGKEH